MTLNYGIFDNLEGLVAAGWAWDPQNPERPVTVDFYVGERRVGSTIARDPRPDVTAISPSTPVSCGFRVTLNPIGLSLNGAALSAVIRELGIELRQSPHSWILPAPIFKWITRGERSNTSAVQRLKRRLNRKAEGAGLSIVIPFFNTPMSWLIEAVESVRNQWCDHWELICVDDASTDQLVSSALQRYAEIDGRITYVRNSDNLGIAASMNVGIRQSKYEMVAFMDHDDYLEADAVYHYLRAARLGADLIYCDEFITGKNIDDVLLVAARPAFSYYYYLSHPYFVHMICVRRHVIDQVNGWDEAMAISADVDFVLRVIQKAKSIAHVAKVLYRWRTHDTGAGHQHKTKVMEASTKAIQRHLDAMGAGGRVTQGLSFNHFRVSYPKPSGKTLIVIPTKNSKAFLERCVSSIERTTKPDEVKICVIDHESDDPETIDYLRRLEQRYVVWKFSGEFNFSLMNNEAVRVASAGCDFVAFLNNDTEAVQRGWLERLTAFAARPDVGVVGATLIYGNGQIQHSGVIVGINGLADHAHRYKSLMCGIAFNEGYISSLVCVRDYTAVTAACMVMRTSIFHMVDGFDPELKIAFNDTDLCIRVAAHGYKNLNVSDVILFHYESQTRGHRAEMMDHLQDSRRFRLNHKYMIAHGDDYYNPIMSQRGADHELTFADIRWTNLASIRFQTRLAY